MTTAVEVVATELSAGSFGNQQNPSIPVPQFASFWLDGTSSMECTKCTSVSFIEPGVSAKLGGGSETASQPQEANALPHWMDSKQPQSRSKDVGSRMENASEMGPSTPMQGTPKPKHSVEATVDTSELTTATGCSDLDGHRPPLSLEFVEGSPGMKHTHLSVNPAKVHDDGERSQKENMLAISLGSHQSVSAGHRLQVAQKRHSPHRVGQPPPARALATLASPKISICPGDLQLQQPPTKSFPNLMQASFHIDGLQTASSPNLFSNGQQVKGTGVSTPARDNASVQLELFRTPRSVDQSHEPPSSLGKCPNSFGTLQQQFKPFSRALVSDAVAESMSMGMALCLQDGSYQAESWAQSRPASAVSGLRWPDVYSPAMAKHQDSFVDAYRPAVNRSPSVLLSPCTPSDGGYMQLLTGTLNNIGKPSQVTSNAGKDGAMSDNPSRKRKYFSPENAAEDQLTTSHEPLGLQHHRALLDPGRVRVELSQYSRAQMGTQCVLTDGHQPSSVVDTLTTLEVHRAPARERLFFPGGKITQLSLSRPIEEKVAPGRVREPPQFATPMQDQSQHPGFGRHGRHQQAELLTNGGGKCYVFSAHSPIPVPDSTFSAGEPTLPLSLNFASNFPLNGKAQRVNSVKPDADWGKSLALAASPEKCEKVLSIQDRCAEMQLYFRQYDESKHESVLQVFRSMSAAARSGHALHLETRALWLNHEEGRQMEMIKSLDLMGIKSGGNNTREMADAVGFTPHGPRLPAPGNASTAS